MKNFKNNIQQRVTISKGYRLRPSTHRHIKNLQISLNATQDKIISMAIKLFSREKKDSGKAKN